MPGIVQVVEVTKDGHQALPGRIGDYVKHLTARANLP
jgi:hypothetical protein